MHTVFLFVCLFSNAVLDDGTRWLLCGCEERPLEFGLDRAACEKTGLFAQRVAQSEEPGVGFHFFEPSDRHRERLVPRCQ